MKNKAYKLIGLAIVLGSLIYFVSVFSNLMALSERERVDYSSYPSVIDSLIPMEYRKGMKFIRTIQYETFGVITEFKDKDGGRIHVIQLHGNLGQVKKEARALKTAKDYGYFMDPFSMTGYKSYFTVDEIPQVAINDFDLLTDAKEIKVLKEENGNKSYLMDHLAFMQLSLNNKDLFHLKRNGKDHNRSIQLILKEHSDSTYIVLKLIQDGKYFPLIW